jgi:ribose transport system substrate-binding protein
MKKLFAVLLAVLMVIGMVGCSKKEATPTDGGEAKKTVYIMGPTPDHGWTAQAGTYAERKAKEIAAAGEYNATYIPASSGEEQVDQCNQIVANGDAAVVVMMPLEDSAAAGQEALYAAGIPFISFDRIIESTEKYAALNTSGDNWAVGAGIAYWLQQKGLKPGDTVLVLWGDNGTVCKRRAEGFEQFLKGEREYEDQLLGKFKTAEVWTQEQVDAVMNGYSKVVEPNWSADGASEYLNQKLTEILDVAAANTGKLFIYSMDDEMTFGVLNTLDTQITGTDYEAKAEGLEIYCSAIGGMQELYDVMSGKDATRAAVSEKYFDDIMSMYFSPKMMSDVIDKGLDFLSGNWSYNVGDGYYTPVFMVTKDTAGSTEGFTGH